MDRQAWQSIVQRVAKESDVTERTLTKAKPRLKLVIANKVFLVHSLAHSYDCFCSAMAELSSCNTEHLTHRAPNVYYMTFCRKGLLTTGWLRSIIMAIWYFQIKN